MLALYPSRSAMGRGPVGIVRAASWHGFADIKADLAFDFAAG